jgi:hypothetical protein
VLDDSGDRSICLTHDASVTGGVLKFSGQNGDGIASADVCFKEFRERFRIEHWDIARYNDDRSLKSTADALTLCPEWDAVNDLSRVNGCVQDPECTLDSASGSGDRVLIDDDRLRIEFEHVLGNLIAFVANDNGDSFGIDSGCCGESVAEHRAPGQRVQNLRSSGFHPRSFSCCKNNYGRGLSGCHRGFPNA